MREDTRPSLSLANGAIILKAKEMAGYASLATTQRYLHDLEALADNAVDYNPLTRAYPSRGWKSTSSETRRSGLPGRREIQDFVSRCARDQVANWGIA